MSQNESSKPTTTSIKIAAKDSSQRSSAGGPADPGPGDPSAAPSIAPQLVDIPDPPTASELVVKSATSRGGSGPNLPTLKEVRSVSGRGSGGPGSGYKSTIASSMAAGVSGSKSHSIQGSQAGPAASNPSVGAPREPTSSRLLTGPTGTKMESSSAESPAESAAASSAESPAASSAESPAASSAESPAASSTASPAKSKVESNVRSVSGGAGGGHGVSNLGGLNGKTSPASSVAFPAASSAAASAASSGKSKVDSNVGIVSGGTGGSHGVTDLGSLNGKTSPASSAASSAASSGKSSSKDGKKVARFRYHKRITVRTSGKTSPSTIMHKVNKKDHNAGITPSTIEDMDPNELMKRAGIKGNKQTHWRVRLRQTKRLTKNGKTTTQTKVAYRDSEGNKRVKTSSTPYCKKCSKKLEECKCDSNSQA